MQDYGLQNTNKLISFYYSTVRLFSKEKIEGLKKKFTIRYVINQSIIEKTYY